MPNHGSVSIEQCIEQVLKIDSYRVWTRVSQKLHGMSVGDDALVGGDGAPKNPMAHKRKKGIKSC